MAKTVKKPVVPVATEADLQTNVCEYLRRRWPGVCFNAPSAVQFTNVVAQAKAKRLGANSSYPDLLIFRACGGYHGLMIEFKAPGKTLYKKDGTPRRESVGKDGVTHFEKQLQMHEQLRAEGYAVYVVQEFSVAVRIIEEYLTS